MKFLKELSLAAILERINQLKSERSKMTLWRHPFWTLQYFVRMILYRLNQLILYMMNAKPLGMAIGLTAFIWIAAHFSKGHQIEVCSKVKLCMKKDSILK